MSELDSAGHGNSAGGGAGQPNAPTPAGESRPGPHRSVKTENIYPPEPAAAGAPRSRSHLWVWALLVVVVLICIFGFRSYRQRATAAATAKTNAAPPVVEIAMATARKGDVGAYISGLLGIVTPIYTVAVKSRVDGQLMTVSYKEGQLVKAGDPLLEIDPRPYQALLTSAEGQHARDAAMLEDAKIDLARYQEAYASNAIPKQQLDTQVWTVHQDEGTVQFDQGQVENAKVNLAYCHITSPITGRAGLRLLDPGNIVHASDTTPLVIVAQLQPITVVFSVAEDDLPRIQKRLKQGQPMLVEALDRAQKTKLATGTVLTLDNQVDLTTGTLKIKAMFTNADEVLFPNQFVNARLLVETEHDAVLVPTQAIQRNPQGPFVYVVSSGQTNAGQTNAGQTNAVQTNTGQTVSMRAIKLGTRDGEVTAVTGVEAGEQIATDNFNRLQEGAKVAARKSPGAKAGGGRRGGGGAKVPASP
jgi:multidrug efflux system membrane fusion protein